MFFTQRLCHMRTRHIQQPLNFDRNVREKDLSLPQPTLCEDCLMSELMHLQQSKSPCLIFQEGKVHIVFLLELYMSKQTEAERSGIQAAAVDAHTWIFSLTNAFPTEDCAHLNKFHQVGDMWTDSRSVAFESDWSVSQPTGQLFKDRNANLLICRCFSACGETLAQ